MRSGPRKEARNGPWSNKRQGLAEHSTLHLNKRLLERYGEAEFDDEAIEARGRALGELACRVWKRPDAQSTAS